VGFGDRQDEAAGALGVVTPAEFGLDRVADVPAEADDLVVVADAEAEPTGLPPTRISKE